MMWISITCNTSLGHYVHTQKISQEQVVLDIRNYNSSVRSIITDAWRTARTLPHHYCLALSTITIMMLKVCLSNILNGHGGPTTYPIAFANCLHGTFQLRIRRYFYFQATLQRTTDIRIF